MITRGHPKAGGAVRRPAWALTAEPHAHLCSDQNPILVRVEFQIVGRNSDWVIVVWPVQSVCTAAGLYFLLALIFQQTLSQLGSEVNCGAALCGICLTFSVGPFIGLSFCNSSVFSKITAAKDKTRKSLLIRLYLLARTFKCPLCSRSQQSPAQQ